MEKMEKVFKIRPAWSNVTMDDSFDGTVQCGGKCSLSEDNCVDCVMFMTQQEIQANWSNGGLIVRLFND